jgi:hypothetical protein
MKDGNREATETSNKFCQTEVNTAVQAEETLRRDGNTTRGRLKKLNCQSTQQGSVLTVALHNACLDFCVS